MKFATLFNKIGKQNLKQMTKADVYVLDYNGEKRNLELKFDAKNNPYFVFNRKTIFRKED